MKKRVLSALLALCMALTLLPAAVAAGEYTSFSTYNAFAFPSQDEEEGGDKPVSVTFDAVRMVQANVSGGPAGAGTTPVTYVLVKAGSRVSFQCAAAFSSLSSMGYPYRYLSQNNLTAWGGYWPVLNFNAPGTEATLTAEEFFAGGAYGAAFEVLWVDEYFWDEGTDTGGVQYYVIMSEERYNSAMPTALSATQSVLVDGKPYTFFAYALYDANGGLTNYVKLRDVAIVLSGTHAQFEVGWDGSINLETGTPYTAMGGEMAETFLGSQPYEVNSSPVNIDGSPVELEAITLWNSNGTYNYFKLRDLGKALNFNVGWSKDTGVFIESNQPYTDAD